MLGQKGVLTFPVSSFFFLSSFFYLEGGCEKECSIIIGGFLSFPMSHVTWFLVTVPKVFIWLLFLSFFCSSSVFSFFFLLSFQSEMNYCIL